MRIPALQLAVCSLASHLTSLSRSLLICKMEVRVMLGSGDLARCEIELW